MQCALGWSRQRPVVSDGQIYHHGRGVFSVKTQLRTLYASALIVLLAACGESPTTSDVPVITLGDRMDLSRQFTIGSAGNAGGGLQISDGFGQPLTRVGDGVITGLSYREGIPLSGENSNSGTVENHIVIAAADHADKTIKVYSVGDRVGVLNNILDADIPLQMDDPTGLCLYRSPVDEHLYAIVTDRSGLVRQWLLYDSGQGTLRSELVRSWSVGEQVFDCRVEDYDSWIDIKTADAPGWRYGAEPDDSTEDREEAGWMSLEDELVEFR